MTTINFMFVYDLCFSYNRQFEIIAFHIMDSSKSCLTLSLSTIIEVHKIVLTANICQQDKEQILLLTTPIYNKTVRDKSQLLLLAKSRKCPSLSVRDLPFSILQQENFVVEFIMKNHKLDLAQNEDFLLEHIHITYSVLRKNGMLLEYLSDTLKADKDIVSVAVLQNPRAIQFASDNLKNDKNILKLVSVE